MAGLPVDGDPHIHAAFSAYGEAVVHPAGFQVEGAQAALGFFRQQLVRPGPLVGDFLIGDEKQFDGMPVIADFFQHFGQVDRHDNPPLHVADPGAIGLSFLDGEGIFRVAAVGEHRIQVSAQEDGLAGPFLPGPGPDQGDRPGFHQFAFHSQLLEIGRHLFHQGLHPFFFLAAGLEVDQILPKIQHVLPEAFHRFLDLFVLLLHGFLLCTIQQLIIDILYRYSVY